MKIKIDKINSTELSEFITKLLSVDTFIYIKLTPEKVISNVYLEKKDAVKLQEIPISNLFTINDKVKKELEGKELKVSFFNGRKVIEALKLFSTEDLNAVVEYSESTKGLIATSVTLKDSNTKINLKCADPEINFMDLTDDQIKGIFNEDSKVYEFELTTDHIDNMNKLFNYEKEVDTFDLLLENGEVSVKGENYVRALCEVDESNVDEYQVKIYKKFLGLMDHEYYTVKVLPNKLILISVHSNTRLTFAKCNE